jgi:DNA-binding response OmpR family regulator
MPLRVLLVASSSPAASQLRADLTRLGAQVTALSPAEVVEQASELRAPQAVVVDLCDPALDWDEAREAIARRRLRDTPVLAVVPAQRLGAFEAGDEVADFISAPYREVELRARLARLATRANGDLSASAIRVGDLTLDPDRYEVTLGGARVDLTLKEYELLKYLVTRPGRAFTRDQLLDAIWGYDYVGGMRTVDVHIRRLRAKLGDIGETTIETIRGVGYAFRPPRESDHGAQRVTRNQPGTTPQGNDQRS